MSDINMRILLSAIGGASVVSSVQSIASSLGNGSGGLGGALLGIGAAAATVAVGIGVTAVKAAGDFQSGMTTLVTGAGEAQKNIGLVSNGILNLADSTGATTAQLTSAMYQTESAGYHGAAGLSVLAAAARGARVGNADLGTVADATTTIMTDFGIKSGNASVAVNTLIATVANGKTTMDQLAASLSQIMPTASAAGVSLTDTSAAMATMTGEGVPAANAATYLRQTILGLEAPSKQTVTALANVGLTSSQVSDEMKKSLPGALKMITDAVGKQFPAGSAEYVNAIKNISGGAKTMQGMLDLTGSHMATFNANVANISSAVKNGGNSITGWALVQQDFNFKMAQAGEVVQTLMIRIGQQLLPTVTQIASALLPVIISFSDWVVQSGIITTGLSDLATGITTVVTVGASLVSTGASIIDFFQHSQLATGVLMVALGALGGVMALFAASSAANAILSMMEFGLSILTTTAEAVTGAATMTTTFGTMAGMIAASMGTAAMSILAVVGPLLLIGAVVVLVGVGIVLAVQHWSEISLFLQSTWSSVLSWFNSALKSTEGPIRSVIGWFNAWKTPITDTAIALGVFFGPALIKAGVEAVISGGKIAISFVQTMIQTGTQAVINGAKTSVSFVATMIKSGVEAVISGAKITVAFVGSMIQTGIQAVVNGAKVVGSFVASLIASGMEGWQAAGKIALFIGSLIASGVQSVIAGAKIVASFIASLISTGIEAATTGATMMASLVPAIISVAAEGVIAAATAIPGLIAGFIAWAISAGAAAIATIAATWPILLIIGAIALLVVGIVLLVTHWKQVTAFLQSTWARFVAWIAPAIQSVGNFFVSVFNGIKSFLQSAWNFIVANARTGALLLLIVITGPTGILVALIISHWSQISSFISTTISTIVDGARSGWSILTSDVSSAGATIVNLWNGLWSNVRTIATNLWNGVVSIFNGAKTTVSGIISSLGSDIVGIMNSWPGMALQAGINIVNGIANGIRSVIGNVTSAISSVTSAIAAYLPKSPAKEGELSHLNEYGPALVTGISTGIIQSLPIMLNAMDMLTTPVGSAMAAISDPRTVADQLNFTKAPTSISSGLKKPVETAAQKKKEEEEKKAEAKKKEEEKKAAAAEKAHEKKVVHADIKEIKAELHIHTSNAKLDKAQIDEIIEQAMRQFGLKLGDEIRAQFGNV